MPGLNPFVGIWRTFIGSYRRILHVRLLLIGLLVGVLSGFAAVAFYASVEALKHLFLSQMAGMEIPAPAGERLIHGEPGPFRPWIIPVILTLVGLATGWLVSRFIPDSVDSGTDGTDAMIKTFHQKAGKMEGRNWLIRGVLAVFTIAGGGSAGREGPISQLGAGLGSWLSDRLKLTARERRIILLAGASGGLGAIFRAPMGGALTAVEVIYREDFEAEAILPSVFSSVVAYSIFTLFFGTDPIFTTTGFKFTNPFELPFYVILALACSAMGYVYLSSFFFIKYRVFRPVAARAGLVWTTALGGLVMGLIGMMYPEVLSGGYGWLEKAILFELPLMTMAAIIVGKTLATSVTIGSGMSGGMFAPALFVGGMTGGIVGHAAHHYYPNVVTQPGGYVLVGMAAFFTGVANAPIGPIIMVSELTQGYGLLAPLMLASAICLILCRNISLYENQVENKFESPAHLGDATINILEQLRVRDYFHPGRITVFQEDTNFRAITDTIVNTNEFYFPIKNDSGEITGILAVQDIRRVLFEESLRDLLLAKDVARKPVTLTPEDELYTALLLFVDTDLGQIPVVSPDDPHEILGLINREDVFEAYSKTIRAIKKE